MRVRKSLSVLFDERDIYQGIGHVHGIRRRRIFLKDHSIFVTLEPSGKTFPSAGRPFLNACIITGLARIALILVSVLLTATSSRIFVASEVGPRKPVWYSQRVSVSARQRPSSRRHRAIPQRSRSCGWNSRHGLLLQFSLQANAAAFTRTLLTQLRAAVRVYHRSLGFRDHCSSRGRLAGGLAPQICYVFSRELGR